MRDKQGQQRRWRAAGPADLVYLAFPSTQLPQNSGLAPSFETASSHCVLHTDQLVRLAQLPTAQQAAFHRGRADHEPCQDTEWQANALASALLMPAKGIQALEVEHNSITVSLVAMQFQVSLEAAGYRLDLYQNRRE